MMKASGLVVCAILLAAAPCMAVQMPDLPPVTYSPTCQYVADIDAGASMVFAILGGLITPPPAYDTVDLDGDGIPDKHQLALLGSALCASPALQAQLEINKTAFAGLVTDLLQVVGILIGTQSGTPPAYFANGTDAAARLTAAADILEAITPAPTGIAVIITAIDDAAAEINGLLTVDVQGYMTLLPTITSLLTNPQVKTAVAALVGLSSDLQLELAALLNDTAKAGSLMDQILAIRDQVAGIVAAVPALAELITVPADKAKVLALAADANSIVLALNRTLTLVGPPSTLKVYGVSGKSAGEPFSGAGDYDADDNTNLVTYNATTTIAGFVAAASGANPFWPGNTNMPVAGVLGLIALAGACALGGASSIRRK